MGRRRAAPGRAGGEIDGRSRRPAGRGGRAVSYLGNVGRRWRAARERKTAGDTAGRSDLPCPAASLAAHVLRAAAGG